MSHHIHRHQPNSMGNSYRKRRSILKKLEYISNNSKPTLYIRISCILSKILQYWLNGKAWFSFSFTFEWKLRGTLSYMAEAYGFRWASIRTMWSNHFGWTEHTEGCNSCRKGCHHDNIWKMTQKNQYNNSWIGYTLTAELWRYLTPELNPECASIWFWIQIAPYINSRMENATKLIDFKRNSAVVG